MLSLFYLFEVSGTYFMQRYDEQMKQDKFNRKNERRNQKLSKTTNQDDDDDEDNG